MYENVKSWHQNGDKHGDKIECHGFCCFRRIVDGKQPELECQRIKVETDGGV